LATLGEGGTGEVAVSAVRKVFTEIDKVDSGKLNDANQLVQAHTARTAAEGAGGAGTAMETTNNLLKTLIDAVGEVNVSVSSNPGEIVVKLNERELGRGVMKYIDKETSLNR
jgi:carbon monoxide dehydrogenase subunit G